MFTCQFCKRSFGEGGHPIEHCQLEVVKGQQPKHVTGKLFAKTEETRKLIYLAMEFALKNHLLAQLEGQFRYLASYCKDQRTECELYHDFAPYSFGFTMFVFGKNGERVPWFSGGLIYMGPGVDSRVNLSVSVDLRQGWSVHT